MKRITDVEFEELPKRIQHALEVLVEWHSVLVYEIEKCIYGFYVLDEYIHENISNIIDSKFKGKRCKYFLKGTLPMGSLQIEILDLCKFKEGYGFSIELHDNDYGFLDKEDAPAFVHVLDGDELEIGLLNITGPCPKKVSDIKEFRPPHEFASPLPMRHTPLMKHRKNLIKWANLSHIDQNRWEWAQEAWNMFHTYKR
jgi:hypothetical protein